MNTILLIDGNGLIHRAFHALPYFQTKDGIATNAVYGFTTMLFKAVEDFRPTHLVVCFDTPAPTFRQEIFKKYQIQRPKVDDKLIAQFPLVREFLQKAHISYFEKDGFEADDLIGTIVSKLRNKDFKIFILTGDKDIIQLVNEKTFVIATQTGLSNFKIYDSQETLKKFKVKPYQIPDLKSLMGDQSDNYKGVEGIGPKTAANLLQRFSTLENLYQNIEKIENKRIKDILLKYKEDALLSKKLAQLDKNVDFDFNIENCQFSGYNEELRDFFLNLEFYSLIKRFFQNKERNVDKDKKQADNSKKNQLGLF